MLLFEIVLTLLVTLILSSALSLVYANDGLGAISSFWFFFIILFFSVWAGGIWLAPMGPELWNVYWLNFIWAGLMVALLISTIISPRQAYLEALKKFHLKSSQLNFGIETGSVFNLSFWALILLLFAGILSHYIYI